MKQLRLLAVFALGLLGGLWAVAKDVHAQALPPGQEADEAVAKKPPFGGFGLELSSWDSTGVWGGGGAYRNDLGFMIIPSWNIGRRFIGKGPFRTLTLQGRFLFNVPLVGVDDSNYLGDAPEASSQQPCVTSRDGSLRQIDIPRCDWGRGSRRVDYGDLVLVLANPRIYTIPKLGVHIDPTLVFTLPVSVQSRLRSMVLSITPQVGVGREFWKNRIGLAYTFGVGVPFFLNHQADIYLDKQARNYELPYSQDVLDTGQSNFYQTTGTTMLCRPGEPCLNPSYSLQHTIRGTVNFIEPLSLTVIYRISNTNFRQPECTGGDVAYTMIPIDPCANTVQLANTPDRVWRDGQLLWASLSYQALSWLGISLSYITDAPFWQYQRSDPNDPRSADIGEGQHTRSYRQGLFSFDANAFTSINLGVSVEIDQLAAKALKK